MACSTYLKGPKHPASLGFNLDSTGRKASSGKRALSVEGKECREGTASKRFRPEASASEQPLAGPPRSSLRPDSFSRPLSRIPPSLVAAAGDVYSALDRFTTVLNDHFAAFSSSAEESPINLSSDPSVPDFPGSEPAFDDAPFSPRGGIPLMSSPSPPPKAELPVQVESDLPPVAETCLDSLFRPLLHSLGPEFFAAPTTTTTFDIAAAPATPTALLGSSHKLTSANVDLIRHYVERFRAAKDSKARGLMRQDIKSLGLKAAFEVGMATLPREK